MYKNQRIRDGWRPALGHSSAMGMNELNISCLMCGWDSGLDIPPEHRCCCCCCSCCSWGLGCPLPHKAHTSYQPWLISLNPNIIHFFLHLWSDTISPVMAAVDDMSSQLLLLLLQYIHSKVSCKSTLSLAASSSGNSRNRCYKNSKSNYSSPIVATDVPVTVSETAVK